MVCVSIDTYLDSPFKSRLVHVEGLSISLCQQQLGKKKWPWEKYLVAFYLLHVFLLCWVFHWVVFCLYVCLFVCLIEQWKAYHSIACLSASFQDAESLLHILHLCWGTDSNIIVLFPSALSVFTMFWLYARAYIKVPAANTKDLNVSSDHIWTFRAQVSCNINC